MFHVYTLINCMVIKLIVGLFQEFQQHLYCLWISTFSDCKVYFFFKTINIPKFKSKVNFKHKNHFSWKIINAEAFFFYYYDEIDQKTNFEISFM